MRHTASLRLPCPGNYLRPMTPEHRTAWMTRVKMPTPVQWIMALQVNGLCCR